MQTVTEEEIDLIDQANDEAILGTFEIPLIRSRFRAYRSSHVHTWKEYKFTKANAVQIPDNKGGIYLFVARPGVAGIGDGIVMYVGKAKSSFRERYSTYFKTMRRNARRMVRACDGFLYFRFSEMDADPEVIKAEETALIHAYMPAGNQDLEGALTKGKGAFPADDEEEDEDDDEQD